MPVFRLTDEHVFPPPEMSEGNGLLAVGGDLSRERLLLAYASGIFPWYSEGDPVLWWSPDPRLVLFPAELKISRSLRQTLRKETFSITMDTAFREVITSCASVHHNRDGDTWITDEMITAYTELHESGYAHSVEAWSGGILAGGLYGISLGSAFFGESMFTRLSNASKAALAVFAGYLDESGFSMLDCQMPTRHLSTLGAREIGRKEYLALLAAALSSETKRGKWRLKEIS